MKISIGADHRGYRLKAALIRYLVSHGYNVIDQGTDTEKSVDYPTFALNVARDVTSRKARFGILVCYTGQGMAIAANKVRGIRAALCTSAKSARFSRAHNNANVLVLPAGFISSRRKAFHIVRDFLATTFEGGRHQRRLSIIRHFERSRTRHD